MSRNTPFLSLLVVSFLLALPFSSKAQKSTWIPIDGTESPDGKFVIAWGLGEHVHLDTSKPDELLQTLDLEQVKNFIVERDATS